MKRLAILFCALSLVACGSKKEGEAGSGGGAAKVDKDKGGGEGGGGAAPAAAPQKLEKLDNLQADLPAGAKVEDGIGGGVMIMGGGLAMSISAASETSPKTLEEGKKDIEMYTPKDIKEETLPDGWALSFKNEGGMGTNFWVISRREIGGKAYRCETTASSAAQQEAALKVCKSLKP